MMITARNYAAQAERDMMKLINTKNFEKPNIEEINHINKIANLIHKSVKFALPDGGCLLNDELKGLENCDLHLPHPIITIEYYSHIAKRKVLIVANEDGSDYITTHCIIKPEDRLEWVPLVVSNKFKINKQNPIDGVFSVVREQNYIFKFILENVPDLDIATKSHFAMSDISVSVTLELLEALSCRNVYTELLEVIDENKNERRIKAGKLPLYETKILVVDAKPKEVDTAWKGGTHASPRQHLRRGHIRRYPTHNIWISNTIVGKSENGKIDKSYEIK